MAARGTHDARWTCVLAGIQGRQFIRRHTVELFLH